MSLSFRSLLIFGLLMPFLIFGQIKFNPLQLNDDKKYGVAIAGILNTIELSEYPDTCHNCVYLKNGFRSSKFINEKDWLRIKDSVIPYRIDIVYSKYPLRNSLYNEIYPLLFKRLRSVFDMDPGLNSVQIEWNKVLQTHCLNDEQVSKLFHGVVIRYRKEDGEEVTNVPEDSLGMEEFKESNLISEQNSIQDVLKAMDDLENSDLVSDSLRWALKKKSVNQRANSIKLLLAKQIEKDPETDLSKATPGDLKKYDKEIALFLKRYPIHDSVVKKVLDRHPEWKNSIVINDWTGSMYSYGAQVLQWHLNNFERSGIKSLTLFNDGDSKDTKDKKIGETGGIYSTKADNVTKLVHLFNYMMMKGGGGDGPENDIEAILEAQHLYPDNTEVILIADNNACVRDIELAGKIGKPVKVIVCGYDPAGGVNPDFVYLAKVTGGGLYTIEQDLENIAATTGDAGEIRSLSDTRFKIMAARCNNFSTTELNGELYTDYKKALHKKRKVHRLKLEEVGLTKVPNGVYKMKRLHYLNLSHNFIGEISPKIENLNYLSELDLSDNKITSLPHEFEYIYYLEKLYLSRNFLEAIPVSILKLRNIVELDLSRNRIQKMDKRFPLKSLVKLSLADNKIKEITGDIGKLKQLKNLDLSNNQITSLPENLVNLTELKELNLSNNNLSHLPARLGRMKKLRVLKLQGNPLSDKEKARIMSLLPKTEITF
jgi:hypothetical protein